MSHRLGLGKSPEGSEPAPMLLRELHFPPEWSYSIQGLLWEDGDRDKSLEVCGSASLAYAVVNGERCCLKQSRKLG